MTSSRWNQKLGDKWESAKDVQTWFSADGCTGWYFIKHHSSAKLHSISGALDILFTSPRGTGSKGKNWTGAITEEPEQMAQLWWSAFAQRETVPIPSGPIAKEKRSWLRICTSLFTESLFIFSGSLAYYLVLLLSLLEAKRPFMTILCCILLIWILSESHPSSYSSSRLFCFKSFPGLIANGEIHVICWRMSMSCKK